MSVVHDLDEQSETEDDCVLESVTYVDYKCLDKNNYDYIYNENPLLAEFIEKCYDIENSKAMSEVIKKILLKHYNETNKAFKTSSRLKETIKKSIVLLKTDPSKIFCQIKLLCNILTDSSVIRRIKPTTLSTNLKDKCPEGVGNGILKRKNSFNNDKASKVYIINSYPIEDLTEENQPIYNDIENGNLIIDLEKQNKRTPNDSGSEEDNKLLVPQKVIEIGDNRDALDLEKVKKIEKEIARCKTIIAKLDEQEVDDDSFNSPYIKSEKLKAKIVLLYKQLCNLTGNEPVKKRMINLRVIEGHPKGPVHCLESFLNNNIGPDGDPPFPDFSDVVECVREANDKDSLGWTKHQILQEARALFTQCGRALQRRRQNREWQDLLHKVKLQRCDEDPADSDPALLKRLEENKQTAVQKESEILERYSLMQTVPQNHVTVGSHLVSNICDETELDESTATDMTLPISDISHNLSQDNELQSKSRTTEEDIQNAIPNEINEIKIKKEPEEEIEERLRALGDNYTRTVVEILEDPFLVIEISDSSDDEGS